MVISKVNRKSMKPLVTIKNYYKYFVTIELYQHDIFMWKYVIIIFSIIYFLKFSYVWALAN